MSYDVAVTVKNLPPDLAVEEIQPPTVTVTFSEPRRAFYLFDPDRARVIVDAALADQGRRTFNISQEDVQHPPAVTVEEVNPSVIKLSLRKPSRTTRLKASIAPLRHGIERRISLRLSLANHWQPSEIADRGVRLPA